MNENEETALRAFEAYFSALVEASLDSSTTQQRHQEFREHYLALSDDEKTTMREHCRHSQAFRAYCAQTSPLQNASPITSVNPDPAEIIRSLEGLVAVVYPGDDTTYNSQ